MTRSRAGARPRLRRRTVLRQAARALGVFAAARIGGPTVGLMRNADAASPVKLTMFANPGLNLAAVAHEIAKFYMAGHPGVTIEVLEGTTFEVYPKMLSAHRLTPDQPLVHFGYMNPLFLAQGDVDGMWDALEPAAVPNMATILDAYLRPGNRGVGFSSAPVGLVYSTKFVKDPPTSWTDLWNPRFKGKVTAVGKYNWYINGLIVAARLNGGSEKNIDPGFRLWAQHADQYVAFANGNDQQLDMMIHGDAYLGAQFGGNVLTWKSQGAPVEFVIPKEGLIAFPQYFVVLNGCTPAQKRIAEDVINLLLSERWLARYATLTYFVPLTKRNIMPPSLRTLPIYNPAETARALQLDWPTIVANDSAWRQRWDKEVVAKIP